MAPPRPWQQWEACEVAAERLTEGFVGSRYRFVADALGPAGRYVAAASAKEFTIKEGLLVQKENATDLEDPVTRGGNASAALDDLTDALIADGWEPAEGRGPHWYALRFRRPAAAPAKAATAHGASPLTSAAAGHKSAPVAYLLWLLLGLVGGHRYYLGRTRSAMLQTVTLGGAGLWWLLDLALLPGMLRQSNSPT